MEKLRIPKTKWRQSVLVFCAASFVAIIDQITKSLIISNIDLGTTTPDEGAFRLAYSTNEGSIFGLGINSTLLLVMAPLIILAILGLFFYYLPSAGRFTRIGIGLLLGGAVGNLIDRIRFGEVTDFLYIDLGFWPLDPWPSFNVADASLTTGIFILIFYFFKMAKSPQ